LQLATLIDNRERQLAERSSSTLSLIRDFDKFTLRSEFPHFCNRADEPASDTSKQPERSRVFTEATESAIWLKSRSLQTEGSFRVCSFTKFFSSSP